MTREEIIDFCEMKSDFEPENEDIYNYIIKALKQQKTGHWIDDEFGSKCSYCDIHTHLDRFDRPMKFKYCSMCGAKMAENEPQESAEEIEIMNEVIEKQDALIQSQKEAIERQIEIIKKLKEMCREA